MKARHSKLMAMLLSSAMVLTTLSPAVPVLAESEEGAAEEIVTDDDAMIDDDVDDDDIDIDDDDDDEEYSDDYGFEDGTYLLKNITSSLGMLHLEAPATLEIDGPDVTLTINTSDPNHDRIYYGKKSEMEEDEEGLDGDPIYDENATTYYDDGIGKVIGYSYTLDIEKSDLVTGIVYFAIRYRDDYVNSSGSSAYAGKWSGSTDHYLTLNEWTKFTSVYLDVENTTSMFKVESARVENDGTDEILYIELSGTGYEELIKGTYEDAIAAGRDKSSWITYYVNDDDLYEFAIPLAEEESYIPVVAVSKRYRAAIDEDETIANYANAFYPRQMVLDRENETLVTGDFDHAYDYAVTRTEAGDFAAADVASLHTVGGPKSNASYTNTLTLTMQDAAYDQMLIGTADAEDKSAAVALSEDNIFVLTFAKSVFTDGAAMNIAAHNSAKDRWVNMTVTIDKTARTVVLTKEEIPEDADYTAVDAAVAEEPTDTSLFTEESVQAMQAAEAAIVRGKTEDEQAAVDEMAANLTAAIQALVLKDGTYQVTGGHKDGMFRLVDIYVVAKDGEMTTYFTLSGVGQKKLYFGTKEEAQEAEDSTLEGIIDEIGEVTNSEGKTGSLYVLPISNLSKSVAVAARGSSSWNDRTIVLAANKVIAAEALPDVWVAVELNQKIAALDTENPDKEVVAALREAYDALSDDAKEQVTSESLETLTAAEETIAKAEEEEALAAEEAEYQASVKASKVSGLKGTTYASKKKLKIQFNAVGNATAYEVAYKKNSASKWTKKVITKTSMTISSLKQGTDVQVKVRAIRTSGDTTVTGKYSSTLKKLVAKPTISSVKKGTKSFTTKWSKISKVSGYQISYSTKSSFSKAKTKTVSKSKKSVTIKSLKKSTRYYVRIRAYKTVNGKKVYGEWSSKKTVKTK